jgi:hypothetical protein
MFIKVDSCWLDITTDFAIHHYRDKAVMKCAGARAAVVARGYKGERSIRIFIFLSF